MLIPNIPPQAIEAERAIIGSVLMDYSALQKVLEITKPEQFYVPNHQVIMQFIQKIFIKGLPVDLITLPNELTGMGLLNDIGGLHYLMDLSESVPTTANIEHYANIVKEKYIRRELLKTAEEIKLLAYDNSIDIIEVLDQSEQKLTHMNDLSFTSDLVPLSDIITQEWEEACEAKENHLTCDPNLIPTGISDVDRKMGGGLNPSDLIIVAARPGQGKSSYVLNTAVRIAKQQGLPVAIFSYEMPKKQIGQRIISTESSINLYHVKTRIMDDTMFGLYTQYVAELKGLPIFVDDRTSTSMPEIKAKCRKLKTRYKKLGAIIIDYLQIMDLDDDENEVIALGKLTKAAKRMAKDLDVPVIALSQLSRAVEQRSNKRPILSDLRSSGSIEQDADIVMFIYRDEYYNPNSDRKRIAEIDFAKNRNGETGKVDVFFDGAFTKFSGLEK